MTSLQTSVLIVGGGPVGLTLAIDLGARGVRCTLVERKDEPAFLPKMERCNARTLEIFRRMGIAERVRAAGYPTSYPMDVYRVTTLMESPLLRSPYPSVDEMRSEIARRNDGVMPLEPYQLISQYTLEPLLKSIAEENPLIDVRFGHELVDFEQDIDGVTAYVRTTSGNIMTFQSTYMVGCDGGSSQVRKQLRLRLNGTGGMRELRQALFRCDRLYDVVSIGHGRHYIVADENMSQIVCQDSCRHFSLHSEGVEDSQMPEVFARTVGAPVDFEMLAVTKWSHNLLCAERYTDRRIFLAGDSVHLVIPTAGLGLNTGIGDAIDLSWKLAATLAGWGGPEILASYEDERRAIGVRNVAASGAADRARRERRTSAYCPWLREDSERGRAARENFVRLAKLDEGTTTVISGIERGYRYTESPIVCHESGEGPDPNNPVYVPTSWPGARLPHVWLNNGNALLDQLGPWYTIVSFGDHVDTAGLEYYLNSSRVPYETLILDPNEPARDVYEGFDAFLIRPDLHVAWRASRTPDDPEEIVATAIGTRPGSSPTFPHSARSAQEERV